MRRPANSPRHRSRLTRDEQQVFSTILDGHAIASFGPNACADRPWQFSSRQSGSSWIRADADGSGFELHAPVARRLPGARSELRCAVCHPRRPSSPTRFHRSSCRLRSACRTLYDLSAESFLAAGDVSGCQIGVSREVCQQVDSEVRFGGSVEWQCVVLRGQGGSGIFLGTDGSVAAREHAARKFDAQRRAVSRSRCRPRGRGTSAPWRIGPAGSRRALGDANPENSCKAAEP